YNDIGGVPAVDDVNLILNVPAEDLKPETSDNYTARVVYYFEPVGNFGITATENRLKNATVTTDTPITQTGFADEFPSNYDVRTHGNAIGVRTAKNLTFDYRQNLTLPGIFKRTTVFANYTRNENRGPLEYAWQ